MHHIPRILYYKCLLGFSTMILSRLIYTKSVGVLHSYYGSSCSIVLSLPLQGVGPCADIETKLQPPVSHNDNHTEPRNPSQEEQPHYEVPTHNTLENNALEVREKNE